MRKMIILMALLPSVVMANPFMHEPPEMMGGSDMPPHCMMHEQHNPGLPPYLQGVALTDEQKNQIRTLMSQHFSSMGAYRDKEDILQQQLRSLPFSKDYDADKVNSLLDELMQVKKSEMHEHIDLDRAIFNVLTEEQQQQLQQQPTMDHKPKH